MERIREESLAASGHEASRLAGPRFWSLFVLCTLPSLALGWGLGFGPSGAVGVAVVLGGIAAATSSIVLGACTPVRDATTAASAVLESRDRLDSGRTAAALTARAFVPEMAFATHVASTVVDGVVELRRGPIQLGLVSARADDDERYLPATPPN